jgi:hypothetical protein
MALPSGSPNIGKSIATNYDSKTIYQALELSEQAHKVHRLPYVVCRPDIPHACASSRRRSRDRSRKYRGFAPGCRTKSIKTYDTADGLIQINAPRRRRAAF